VRKWTRTFAALIVLFCISEASCDAAEVRVFSDGPLRTALTQIVASFRTQTGHDVQVVYDTAPALRARLAAGEKVDVLISLASEIAELAKSGRLAATQESVASIKLGLAVRKGVVVPDIKTLDAFKRTILGADTIIHNDLASGRAFARQLERIGVAEQVKSKIVLVKGNGQLEELAIRTGNDVASGQLTQIIASSSVQLVGPLPPEAQTETFYSAAAFSDSQSLSAAREFMLFLTSSDATNALVSVGAK
jgi:molybdate transport system substrate-binding protein